MTNRELVQLETERWRPKTTRMTDRELIQIKKDAMRPNHGGKYYSPSVVLALIEELQAARLFALILAIAAAPRQAELFAEKESEEKRYARLSRM